ncbi:hypothetical protein OKW18_006180 [Streptomyces pratensis]|nr:hypothetical protein [Streptomyces pratensis]
MAAAELGLPVGGNVRSVTVMTHRKYLRLGRSYRRDRAVAVGGALRMNAIQIPV